MGQIILGAVLVLIGLAMLETLVMGSYNEPAQIIGGLVFSLIFIVVGVMLMVTRIKEIKAKKSTGSKNLAKDINQDSLKGRIKSFFEPSQYDKKILLKRFAEEEPADEKSPYDFLRRFRKNYTAFFSDASTKENQAIQWDTTQIFRNILEFRKNRLRNLGLSCETQTRNISSEKSQNALKNKFSDSQYEIYEYEEELVVNDIYKKNGRTLHNCLHSNVAYYTVTDTKQVGDTEVICPSCGAITTREALLDGCDYCGTKFLIEDLESKISMYALRMNYQSAYDQYRYYKNKTLKIIILCLLAVVLLFFTIYAFLQAPTFLADSGTGILMLIAASLFAIIITSVCVAVALFIIYSRIVFPIVSLFGGIDVVSKQLINILQKAPQYDQNIGNYIRQYDPHFSTSTFYSGLQNKIASFIYADNSRQINTFSVQNLDRLLGKYANVVDVNPEYMGIKNYRIDNFYQYADVEVDLKLAKYERDKFRYAKEKWYMKLVKSAQCKTQVVRGPVARKCQNCGAPLDLLSGKACEYCGSEVRLEQYDWVIQDIRFIK